MERLRKILIILGGAFLSFILAYNPRLLFFLPDPELTKIPVILSPLTIALIAASRPYKHHQIFIFTVALPIMALLFGFYLFALVLRNLH